MSVQSIEYEDDMYKVVEILEKWSDWSPELKKAIKIIRKTMWWKKESNSLEDCDSENNNGNILDTYDFL